MRRIVLATCFALCAPGAFGQLGMFTDEQRVAITSAWKGERFADGRPKVPDATLERLKNVSAEEAWSVLRRHRYTQQFEGGWQEIHPAGPRLVGRVVTAVFMPSRPDIHAYINAQGKKEGRVGPGQNSWVIDTLTRGDVLVVDLFGKIENGTYIGDNLGTSIWTKTGTGVVVDGAVRDLTGLNRIEGFRAFVRGFHPSAIADVTLMGMNVPVRIGKATVLPGDIVISDPEGLTFVPAHLAEEVADTSERTQARDRWGHLMLQQGKYTPGQIDSRWTPEMEAEFLRWAEAQGYKFKPAGER